MGEKYRDIFGYLPQEFGFYPGILGTGLSEYMAALKGIGKRETKEKIQELLELVSLTDVRKKKISKLSGGMKRRVGIAQALLNEPKVLILDEPTSGLDPGERMRFRESVIGIRKEQDRTDLDAYCVGCGVHCHLQCSYEKWKDCSGWRDRRTGKRSRGKSMECSP